MVTKDYMASKDAALRMALIFIIAIALTGCGKTVKCINNELWVNVNPMGFGNIYAPTSTICYEDKEK